MNDTDMVYNIEQEIYNAVRKVKKLGDYKIQLDSRFDEFGVTSLEFITIIYEIEDAYNINIVKANLDDFKTIREARDLVIQLVNAKKPENHI